MLLFNLKRGRKTGTGTVISIHLMLLFNWLWHLIQRALFYFNTSNVTIQREDVSYKDKYLENFNTSNVTIQPYVLNTIKNLFTFQYI